MLRSRSVSSRRVLRSLAAVAVVVLSLSIASRASAATAVSVAGPAGSARVTAIASELRARGFDVVIGEATQTAGSNATVRVSVDGSVLVAVRGAADGERRETFPAAEGDATLARRVAETIRASADVVGTDDSPTPAPRPSPPPPSSAPDASLGDAEKKTTVGADVLVLLPISELRDLTGPLIGPVLGAGYRTGGSLELTLRTGYLYGTTIDHLAGNTRLSVIPVWAGARYFIFHPDAGLYGAGELGLNVLLPTLERPPGAQFFEDPADRPAVRVGANAGIGYVISKDVPLDIRGQLTLLSLQRKDSTTILESTYFAVGLSAGFAFHL